MLPLLITSIDFDSFVSSNHFRILFQRLYETPQYRFGAWLQTVGSMLVRSAIELSSSFALTVGTVAIGRPEVGREGNRMMTTWTDGMARRLAGRTAT
jgi:hypothetical protein